MLATIDNCCGTWCYFRNVWEDKPCWGVIDVVDEEYSEDYEYHDWIHACEGHQNRWNGPYIPMPSVES